MNYQDSGNGRYYNTFNKNEALADVLTDALNAEKHIEISKRLSSHIRQWAGMISEFPYKTTERTEQEIKQIIAEIMLQVKFL